MQIQKELSDEVKMIIAIILKRMRKEYFDIQKDETFGFSANFLKGYQACIVDLTIILKDEFDCEIK